MRRMLPVLVLLLATAWPHAAQRSLTPRDVDEALLIGQSRLAADRTRFHNPYRITVARAPVDYVDVITPFRRVVLAAGERLLIGDRSFGQRQALELLATSGDTFDFLIELTFHPLNTFVGIPSYDVTLAAGPTRIPPKSIDRVPRFRARVDGLPPSIPTPALGSVKGPSTQPMLGGTITARFGADAIDPAGAIDLVVSDGGAELARARIDLGRLR